MSSYGHSRESPANGHMHSASNGNEGSQWLDDDAGKAIEAGLGEGVMGKNGQALSLELSTFQATDFNVASIVSGLTDGLIAQEKMEGGGTVVGQPDEG